MDEQANSTVLAGQQSLGVYVSCQDSVYVTGRMHRTMMDYLQALERGDIDRLMIFTPPQHGKTHLVSELFPSWYMGRHPENHIVVSSYAQPRADDFGEAIRYYVTTDYHRAMFPTCKLRTDSKAKDDFGFMPFEVPGQGIRRGGAVRCVGRKGSITGLPAKLIVVDDPEKDEDEARSELVQREIRTWWNTVIKTRRAPDCGILICKTRWDPDDLAGWLLDRPGEREKWTILELPALGTWQPDGTRIADDEHGEALCPERGYTTEWMLETRDGMDRNQWLSLYQQKPTKYGDDQSFDKDWIQNKKIPISRHHIEQLNIYIVVDPANGKKHKSDFTAMWVVGTAPDRNFYWLDLAYGKLNQGERWDTIKALHYKWNSQARVIRVGWEDYSLKADTSYMNEKMEQQNYRFEIVPLASTLEKQHRIKALVGKYRDGQMWFSNDIPGLDDFIENEYCRWPVVRHDDRLDAQAHLFNQRMEISFPNSQQKEQQIREAYEDRQRINPGSTYMSW